MYLNILGTIHDVPIGPFTKIMSHTEGSKQGMRKLFYKTKSLENVKKGVMTGLKN